MNQLEEQLTHIVEKEQDEEIIPFLQKLTQEERNSLVPLYKKLHNHYCTLVQLSERTYGTRATDKQHRIFALTAYVILQLKDIEKLLWGIYPEQLEEILAWYTPTWLNTYWDKRSDNEFTGFYDMNYEILMNWIERGIITIPIRPQTIAQFLVQHINNSDILEKREITLKEHIWHLFEYDCGQNWHDNPSKGTPYFAFHYFTGNGKLDRMRVLRESLIAVNRNLNKNLCGWFAGMFEALNPTIDEQLTLLPEIFSVLSSPQSRPVNIMLGFIKKLCSHLQFPVEEFLEQTTILFASEVKAVHQNTLAILDKLAKEREVYRDTICCSATQALMKPEEAIQSKVVKLLLTYGTPESATLQESLSTYEGMMLTATRKALAAYLLLSSAAQHSDEPVSQGATFISEDKEQMPPIICQESHIQEVESPEDLIFLASQVLDVNELYHFDLLLGALVKWDNRLEAKHIPQWSPVFQRAYKLLISASSKAGTLDKMMATFLIDYARLLIKRFPSEEGKALQTLLDKLVQKDEAQKEDGRYRGLKNVSIRQKWNQEEDLPVQRHLLCHVLNLLQDKSNSSPLLSTPTHAPMFIAPSILAERLKQYQQTGAEPDDMDMQIALSRIALDHSDPTERSTTNELEGEYLCLFRFLLGEEDTKPEPPFIHPSWWMTAGLIKSPETVYPEFKDFAYSEGAREYLTGNFHWRIYQNPYSYYDYLTRTTVTKSHTTLSLVLPEEKNVEIAHKGKYNEKVIYRSLGSTPLLPEMFANKTPRTGNDLARLIWLSPNAAEPILAGCIYNAMWNPSLAEVMEVDICQTTIAAFYQLRHTWHETSYLLEACCLTVSDKATRAYAAELWVDRVSKGSIDSVRLGKIIGIMHHEEWQTIKRLTTCMQQQMMNVSPQHNRELEKLLTAMISELPEKPIKELKNLLEIYSELLSINHSQVKEERVLRLLDGWKGNANLKKGVAALTSL